MSDKFTYDNIWRELELPEFINGTLEKNLSPARLTDLSMIVETSRRLQDLYHTIVNARFNFAISCADQYPHLLAENTERNVLKVKSLFLNNAVMWYNNTFDHILQVIWVYYGLFINKGVAKKITTDRLDQIMSSCKYDSLMSVGKDVVPLSLLNNVKTIYESECYRKIRNWSNIIKHRSCLEYAELDKREVAAYVSVKCKEGQSVWDAFRAGGQVEYNSIKAKEGRKVSIQDVSQNLLTYHKELVSLTSGMYKCLYEV